MFRPRTCHLTAASHSYGLIQVLYANPVPLPRYSYEGYEIPLGFEVDLAWLSWYWFYVRVYKYFNDRRIDLCGKGCLVHLKRWH